MLSHLSFSKCLAIGWVPLLWSLSQTNANATLAQTAIPTIKKEDATEVSPHGESLSGLAGSRAASVGPSFSAVRASDLPPSDDFVRLEATHDAQPESGAQVAVTLSDTLAQPEMTGDVPNQAAIAASLSPPSPLKQGPPPRSPAAVKPQDKSPKAIPKGTAPLLAEFFANLSAADEQPTAIFPPAHYRSQDAGKPPAADAASPLPPSTPADPELGVIAVEDPRRDPELGIIQLRNPLQDPELGILELRQLSPPPPPRPFLYVSTYIAASSSDNVFLVEDPLQGRFGDTFIRPGISVTAFPEIGPQTNLLASVETNFIRYQEQSESSYNEIRFRGGVRHRFTDRVYGQINFSSQMLFEEDYTDQFFTSNGVEVTVGRRDPLTPQLTLDSYYQGQVYFTEPSEFSNVLNSVGAYLGYRFAPQWDTGIGYRVTISDFTRQSRHETYQRITGQIRYSISPTVRVSVFGGLSYGRSSKEDINFDDSFFGISFDATIQIF